MELSLYYDGSYFATTKNGNGYSGCGWNIQDKDGNELVSDGKQINHSKHDTYATTFYAELTALLEGLKALPLDNSIKKVYIYGDNYIVVQMMKKMVDDRVAPSNFKNHYLITQVQLIYDTLMELLNSVDIWIDYVDSNFNPAHEPSRVFFKTLEKEKKDEVILFQDSIRVSQSDHLKRIHTQTNSHNQPFAIHSSDEPISKDTFYLYRQTLLNLTNGMTLLAHGSFPKYLYRINRRSIIRFSGLIHNFHAIFSCDTVLKFVSIHYMQKIRQTFNNSLVIFDREKQPRENHIPEAFNPDEWRTEILFHSMLEHTIKLCKSSVSQFIKIVNINGIYVSTAFLVSLALRSNIILHNIHTGLKDDEIKPHRKQINHIIKRIDDEIENRN